MFATAIYGFEDQLSLAYATLAGPDSYLSAWISYTGTLPTDPILNMTELESYIPSTLSARSTKAWPKPTAPRPALKPTPNFDNFFVCPSLEQAAFGKLQSKCKFLEKSMS